MRKCFDLTLVIVLLVAGALAAAILWPMPVKAVQIKYPICLPDGLLEEGMLQLGLWPNVQMVHPKQIISVWLAGDGKWALISTDLQGVSCLLSEGGSHATIEPRPADEPA